jgi:hypothetical protein
MATKLRAPLKRELEIAGELYMLTIAPEGFKLVPKGKRKGYELTWPALISGDAALAAALQASVADAPAVRREPVKSTTPSTNKKRGAHRGR